MLGFCRVGRRRFFGGIFSKVKSEFKTETLQKKCANAAKARVGNGHRVAFVWDRLYEYEYIHKYTHTYSILIHGVYMQVNAVYDCVHCAKCECEFGSCKNIHKCN